MPTKIDQLPARRMKSICPVRSDFYHTLKLLRHFYIFCILRLLVILLLFPPLVAQWMILKSQAVAQATENVLICIVDVQEKICFPWRIYYKLCTFACVWCYLRKKSLGSLRLWPRVHLSIIIP